MSVVPELLEKRAGLNLRDRVRSIEYTLTGSDFESGFLLYQVLRTAFPKTYASRLRLRFAPLVKMHLENEYPRASVTTRLGKLRFGDNHQEPGVSAGTSGADVPIELAAGGARRERP